MTRGDWSLTVAGVVEVLFWGGLVAYVSLR